MVTVYYDASLPSTTFYLPSMLYIENKGMGLGGHSHHRCHILVSPPHLRPTPRPRGMENSFRVERTRQTLVYRDRRQIEMEGRDTGTDDVDRHASNREQGAV